MLLSQQYRDSKKRRKQLAIVKASYLVKLVYIVVAYADCSTMLMLEC